MIIEDEDDDNDDDFCQQIDDIFFDKTEIAQNNSNNHQPSGEMMVFQLENAITAIKDLTTSGVDVAKKLYDKMNDLEMAINKLTMECKTNRTMIVNDDVNVKKRSDNAISVSTPAYCTRSYSKRAKMI